MIEEQAQVIEIRGGQLILQAQTQSTCGSCAVNRSEERRVGKECRL